MKAVNLIPSEPGSIGRTPAAGAAIAPAGDRPVGAYAILGALALAIVAVALLVLTNNGIADKESELARTQQEAAVVKTQAAQLQSFADFKQLADARTTTVRGLADARFPWPAALEDVSRALPENVFISSLDGSTTSANGGTSSLRGAITAPAIEIKGCASSQRAVARLMSRLRNVRGVTRVSLAKSTRPETAETAAASAPATATDGSTPSVATLPCPKGFPPAFEMVVFFERAPVNPAAAPNAGTGTTGPTGPTGAAGPTGASGSSSATTPASSTTTTTP